MKKGIFFFLLTSYFLLPTSISAQSVDILWEGEGYTPPFYQGRTLWSKQSRVRLLAVPQGLGNPAALDYLWTKNGTVLGNSSGVGKDSLIFADTILSKPLNIKVEIVRGDEDLLAEASLILLPTSPFLAIYEDNPLYGLIFHREIGAGYTMENQEVTLGAFPFFTPTSNRGNPALSYLWRSNNGEAENQNSVTYRAPEGGSGLASVSLNFSNENVILPALQRSFLIQFGKNDE